MTKTV